MGDGLLDDDHAATPVVGKALEAAVVVLYIGLVTAVLYGGVVPTYERTAGDAVADRAVAAAAERVERAVPPDVRVVDVTIRVTLPATIDGREYTLRAAGPAARTLVLEHPDPGIGSRARLALPERVVRVEGTWSSRDPTVVRVTGGREGVVVRLEATDGS